MCDHTSNAAYSKLTENGMCIHEEDDESISSSKGVDEDGQVSNPNSCAKKLMLDQDDITLGKSVNYVHEKPSFHYSSNEKDNDPEAEIFRHESSSSSLENREEECIHNHNGEHSGSSQTESSNAITDTMSGLVISPINLTQDLPIKLPSENNNKFSSVLEKIDSNLVYIPKTHQLIAESSRLNTENSELEDCETLNKVNTQDDVISRTPSTETVLNNNDCDTIEYEINGHKWKINPLETSSLGETDSLLRLKEPDQFTCNSLDLDTSIPPNYTGDSLLRTFNDASSLSSLSTCTDFSVSAISIEEGSDMCIDTGDGGFMEVNLHSRNSYERCKNPSQDSGFEDKGAKPKRRGISAFLSRNLFSRKSKDVETESDQQGWKLFGRVPPKQIPVSKGAQQISCEYQQRTALQSAAAKGKKQDIEVMSTTALILENRPMNLPSKDPEEAEKHRQQYEAMVEAAKKKEQRDLKMKKKHLQQQIKQENQLQVMSKKWASEILPNWENLKNAKRTQDLWWLGLPTNVRGKVWRLAIGNDLNITPELYEICVSRAHDRIKQTSESGDMNSSSNSDNISEPPSSKEASVEVIKLDISRTFPQLCIFQKGGPYHDILHSLLGAYACYRPDVGYVQGMSFIAAVLLLNMDQADTFICFANLLNRPCQVAFFRIDETMMKYYFETYEDFFVENMPLLHSHFKKQNVTPDIYLIDWIFSLYSKALPLDIACRVWDVFCRDGEEFLFTTALGILKMYEEVLVHQDFIHLAQFLTRLPESLSADDLFRSIENIRMTIDKKRFTQILNSKKDGRDIT
ncbi:hypothetical protein FSP39_013939 [Pinctada imbricata]|uniref:Rab-GAP TBC domain-containing protein n=1 Tax=Pinctada imbricata TaxID=66713 RepID=A0AA88Y9A4_PINIB|nr:hypothetical protein FSP39_013939 [Pinctada imbricata]